MMWTGLPRCGIRAATLAAKPTRARFIGPAAAIRDDGDGEDSLVAHGEFKNLACAQRGEGGLEPVGTERTQRHGEGAFKRATASLFYKLINRISDHEIPLDTGDFRLMTRRVVDQLNAMPERFRFIRGMVSWIGFEQTAIEYVREHPAWQLSGWRCEKDKPPELPA